MAAVDLTALHFAAVKPVPVEFGRVMSPDLGGEDQLIDRLGNRWSFECQTPMMAVEPDGRRWHARLMRAVRDGGIIRLRQPNLLYGAPGADPIVAADTASGRTVPLSGLTPGFVINEGMFVTITHDGQRYVDQVEEQVITAVDGTAEISTHFLIRTPLLEGDTVKIAYPEVEGSIVLTGGGDWGANRLTSFAFTVREAA